MKIRRVAVAAGLALAVAAGASACTASDCKPGVVIKGANARGILKIRQDVDGKVVPIQPQGRKGHDIVHGCQAGEHYPECGR